LLTRFFTRTRGPTPLEKRYSAATAAAGVRVWFESRLASYTSHAQQARYATTMPQDDAEMSTARYRQIPLIQGETTSHQANRQGGPFLPARKSDGGRQRDRGDQPRARPQVDFPAGWSGRQSQGAAQQTRLPGKNCEIETPIQRPFSLALLPFERERRLGTHSKKHVSGNVQVPNAARALISTSAVLQGTAWSRHQNAMRRIRAEPHRAHHVIRWP